MFQLADLLEGVSVDCPDFSSEPQSPGISNVISLFSFSKQIDFYSETLSLGFAVDNGCPTDSDPRLLSSNKMLKQV